MVHRRDVMLCALNMAVCDAYIFAIVLPLDLQALGGSQGYSSQQALTQQALAHQQGLGSGGGQLHRPQHSGGGNSDGSLSGLAGQVCKIFNQLPLKLLPVDYQRSSSPSVKCSEQVWRVVGEC